VEHAYRPVVLAGLTALFVLLVVALSAVTTAPSDGLRPLAHKGVVVLSPSPCNESSWGDSSSCVLPSPRPSLTG